MSSSPVLPRKPGYALSVMSPPLTLTSRLRTASRSIHDVSDALVNAKLGLACADDAVWAQGLLVFQPVFAQLEDALRKNRDSLLGEILEVDEALLHRGKAIERDLEFYLKTDDVRGRIDQLLTENEAVRDYVERLKRLSEEDPYLLTAYAYHLYLGLLSGGQILALKRRLVKADRVDETVAFNDSELSLPMLKLRTKEAVNRIGENLDEELRDRIVAEGIRVFELNNAIIRTICGVDDVLYRKLLTPFKVIVLLTFLYIIVNFLFTQS